MKGHDLILAFNANTDIIGGVEKPSRDLKDCVIGTFNVLESMRKLKLKNIIFLQQALYMETYVLILQLRKREALCSRFDICTGKIGSESFISAYSHLYGIHGWMFRFGNVIGARMTHGVIFDFINKLKSNPQELLIRGDGSPRKELFSRRGMHRWNGMGF